MATFQQKAALLKGLITGEVAYTGPFHVSMDVTRRCNLQCPGCRYHSPEVNRPSPGDQTVLDISYDLVEKLCKEFRTMNTHTLFLMGEGEPLLHPRIFDIISTARDNGFHVTLITNGTLLNRDRVRSLLDSKLDALQVSLWASSPQEYKQQYPGTDPDNFKTVVSALKRLTSLKAEKQSKLPSVILHHPINRYNFQSLEAMVNLAIATGCDAISFSPFLSTQGKLSSYSLAPHEETSLCLSLARMRKGMKLLPLNHNIVRTLLRYKLGGAARPKLPCYIGWFHTRFRVDGTVVPCGPCNLPMGNFKENSFREIWNNSPYRMFRRQTSTREGLALLSQQCDCEFCCYLEDNFRVHRVLKWFSLFRRQSKKGFVCSES
jgi:MoaA/NifB/PqqE/SkfB family radical SAM enzyme